MLINTDETTCGWQPHECLQGGEGSVWQSLQPATHAQDLLHRGSHTHCVMKRMMQALATYHKQPTEQLCLITCTLLRPHSVAAGGLGFANAGLGFNSVAEERPANAFDSYREQRSGRYKSSLAKPPPTSFS